MLNTISQELPYFRGTDELYCSGMELKHWVKDARTKTGLTLEKLGEKLGRTKANVHGWEKGLHEPSFNQVIQIAELAGIPPPLPDSILANLIVDPSAAGDVKPSGAGKTVVATRMLAAKIGSGEERVEFADVLSEALGDALQGLPRDFYDRAVTACRRLAESPDSPGARGELLDVLQHTRPEKPVEVSLPSAWRAAAGAAYDTLKREGKLDAIDGDEFVRIVDATL